MQCDPGAGIRPALDPALIQFFSIQLMPTADGGMAVTVVATVCEHEGELESVDLGWRTAGTIDEALAVIRDAVSIH